MTEELDLEYITTVRTDSFDERDRTYPPRPLTGDDAFRAPHEVFLNELFAEPVAHRTRVPIDDYKALVDPSRQQKGEECTGFALASIADYHQRKHLTPEELAALSPDERAAHTASRRMLYEMAQIYDGFAFTEGSTLRGALRGWRRLGVASDRSWPYDPDDEHGEKHGRLTMARIDDAVARPGGLYYRIEPTNREHIRDALCRGFPLYACAELHAGWYRLFLPDSDHIIEMRDGDKKMGGHAFVIAGYDEDGIWIHNSWGPRWAFDGFAKIRWDDWDAWAYEVWFVVPPPAPARAPAAQIPRPPSDTDAEDDLASMWRHVVTVADDGRLTSAGPYRLDQPIVATLLYLFAEHTEHWPERRLAVFADSGNWATATAISQLRPLRDRMMAEHVYPIFLLWEQPWLEAVLPWLHGDPEAEGLELADLESFWAGHGGPARAKVLLADSVAPRAWGEMVDRSCHAGRREDGAARILSSSIAYKWGQAVEGKIEPFDVHLLAHGTGAYLLAELLAHLEMPIASCDLWAPAMVADDFARTFGRRLDSGQIDHVTIRALSDAAERADHVGPAPGSLLLAASEVLSVPGLDLRSAVVADPEGGPPVWAARSQPVIGMERFFDEPAVAARAAAGRLSTWTTEGTHVGLVTDTAVADAAIADIAHYSTGGVGPGKPPPDGIRDPLRRAIIDAERPQRTT